MSAGENRGTWGLLTLCLSVTGAVSAPVIYLRFKAHSGTAAIVGTRLIHPAT